MLKRLVLMTALVALAATSFASVASAWRAGYGGGGSGGSGGGGTTLTDGETYWLTHMREEEKLARDVYLTMYDRWGAAIFANIATSEQRHTDAVEALIDKYGIPDPVGNEAVRGGFADPQLAALYDTLIARGLTSLREAYEVGVDIEVLDIGDLQTAMTETHRTDIDNVYGNLLQASQNHLSAFTSRL